MKIFCEECGTVDSLSLETGECWCGYEDPEAKGSKVCPDCRGDGAWGLYDCPEMCETCDGAGYIKGREG